MEWERVLDPSRMPPWALAVLVVGLLALAWFLWLPFWRSYRRNEGRDFLFGWIEPGSLLYPIAVFKFTFENGCALVYFTLLVLIVLLVWIFS